MHAGHPGQCLQRALRLVLADGFFGMCLFREETRLNHACIVFSNDGNSISCPVLIDRIGSRYYDVVAASSPAPSHVVVQKVACGTHFVVCFAKGDLVVLCDLNRPNHEHDLIAIYAARNKLWAVRYDGALEDSPPIQRWQLALTTQRAYTKTQHLTRQGGFLSWLVCARSR